MEINSLEQLGLGSFEKQRPKNETKKRFVLSPEEFSKERLAAVKGVMGEIQSKYPEVLSLCMFGSMVKGTAHKESDIDGYLFIDTSLIAQKENIPEERIIEHHKTRNATYLPQKKIRDMLLNLERE
mgnify:CR=1 FL=1